MGKTQLLELKKKTVEALLLYGKHSTPYAETVLDLVRRVSVGHSGLFIVKSAEFLKKQVIDGFDPFFPENDRSEIIDFLDEYDSLPKDEIKAWRGD